MTRPNAPSGVSIPSAEVARVCESFDGIVVIDEAYVDFADDDCMDFAQKFENAIVMRTFSKSFSLAGLRIGVAVAQPAVIAEFLKTKDSYNMNVVGQAAGLAAMQDYAHMQESRERVRATRAHLRAQLLELGLLVPESQTNFLLARCDGAPSAFEVFEALNARKILVRYFNARRLDNALRITVGTDEECAALVTALREILGE